MNWGKGLTIAMISFMVFIIVLISILMSNRVDLVSEDYYLQEINYDQEILAKQNWEQENLSIEFKENETHLMISLPNIDGVNKFELALKRPDDNLEDLFFLADHTQTYLIDRNKLKHGQYDYSITCNSGSKKYQTSGKYFVK